MRRIKAGERPYSPKPKPGGGGGRSGSEGKEPKGKGKGKGRGKGKRERSRSQTRSKGHYGTYWKDVCSEKHWCADYAFGSCKKTEGTKGHDQLHHVTKDVVKKEVEKRRAAAKARGVKPDDTGP